ncbi:hypothetical protein HWB51_gp080 [Mycobacterium phage Cuke]|uniref:Uncharacterized protein n=1 Tax=Mycobacterium phage Cuke TaxID=2079417 RepID=A0A2L1IX48_9CAUD|nr:hypothetical protein HWB51_gp080 [Mycobacterium phage Cuke]AVD99732.1 hypothetical protein SEA_CUKE_116 [Mycobacterium phage Cuke]
MIDKSHPRKIVSRKGNATVSYFKQSGRIIAVCDNKCIHHLQSALIDLEKELQNV